MATQTRPCPATATNPWGYNTFTLEYAPVPGLWTLDGVYEVITWDPGNFNDVAYSASNLGFTSAGVGTVTELTATAYGVKCGGVATKCHLIPFVGSGVFGSNSVNFFGADNAFFPTTTPQTVVGTLTPDAAQAAYIKTHMGDASFLIGLDFQSIDAIDNFYVDYMDFSITYSLSTGPSLQKKFLKSFSTLLPSS